MLKTDLHLHTCDCRKEAFITYDAFALIDSAARQGFDVLSITNHDTLTYNTYLRDYAHERGIVLIPGVELTVHGKHILAYNLSNPLARTNSVRRLLELKQDDSLFIAPHPYFPGSHCLKRYLNNWGALFDAVELCHFYTAHINFNKRAIRHAARTDLPLIGTSDCHTLSQLGTTYSLVDAEKDPREIIRAIKRGAVQVVTEPLTYAEIANISHDMFVSIPFRYMTMTFMHTLTNLWRDWDMRHAETKRAFYN